MSIFSIFARKTELQKQKEQYQKALKLLEKTQKEDFFNDICKNELTNQFKQLEKFLNDENLPNEDKLMAIESRIKLLDKTTHNQHLLSEIACERFLSLLEKGKYESQVYLKKFGGDINGVINDYNDTILHLAIQENYDLKVIKALVQAGANVTLKNNDQKTPYDIAIGENQQKNSEYLGQILKQ